MFSNPKYAYIKNNKICKIMLQKFLYLKYTYYESNLYRIKISKYTF
jgi:hypothetical protein